MGHRWAPGQSRNGWRRETVGGSKWRRRKRRTGETEDEERETQECVTKWVPECKTEYEEQCRPTTKKVVSYDDLINDQSCLKPTFVFKI